MSETVGEVPSVYVGLAMAADRWPIEPDCVEILQAGHAATLTSREALVVAKRLVWLADLLGPEPEEEAFTASGTPPGLYAQIVAEAEADGLMREFPVAAAPPPLLPQLTAVQRASVVGMAEAEGVAGLGPRRINWVVWTVWASRRWGRRRAAMLRSLSSAVSHWRLEQGARDD